MPEGMQTPDAMPDWLGMLGPVEESLAQSLRELDAHEQALGNFETDPERSAFTAAWQHCLDQIDDRLGRLKGLIESADRFATEADADLAGTHDVVDQWSAALAATGRRLADTPTRVV